MPRKRVSSGAIIGPANGFENYRDRRVDASQIDNGVIDGIPSVNRYAVAGKSMNLPGMVESVERPVRSVNAGQCRPGWGWDEPFYDRPVKTNV